MLAMELKDIERDGSLAKHQIRQYFPLSINCAIQYIICRFKIIVVKLDVYECRVFAKPVMYDDA